MNIPAGQRTRCLSLGWTEGPPDRRDATATIIHSLRVYLGALQSFCRRLVIEIVCSKRAYSGANETALSRHGAISWSTGVAEYGEDLHDVPGANYAKGEMRICIR